MNTENFNKLFTEDFNNAKFVSLHKLTKANQDALLDPNVEQGKKLEIIEDANEPISEELSAKIQAFILLKKKEGKKQRQIRRLVKRHFGIIVV